MWRLFLWHIVVPLIRNIPLKAGYALATVVGDIVYLLWRTGRISAQSAMRQAIGNNGDNKTISQLARQSFRNFGKYLVDYLRLPLTKLEDIQAALTLQGWENFEEALREEKGLIIVALHQGSYDLGMALVRKHYPVSVVTETLYPAKFNRWFQGVRAKMGIKVVAKEKVWDIAKLLRRKQAVAMLIDSPTEEQGVVVRFLGAQCEVPIGPALLSLRTGANIVTAFFVRQRGNRWLFKFNRPIRHHSTSGSKENIQELTQRIMDSLEEGVRKYPDQWYIFRSLWLPRSGAREKPS